MVGKEESSLTKISKGKRKRKGLAVEVKRGLWGERTEWVEGSGRGGGGGVSVVQFVKC